MFRPLPLASLLCRVDVLEAVPPRARVRDVAVQHTVTHAPAGMPQLAKLAQLSMLLVRRSCTCGEASGLGGMVAGAPPSVYTEASQLASYTDASTGQVSPSHCCPGALWALR